MAVYILLAEVLPWVLKTVKRLLDSCKGEVSNSLAVGQKYQKK